MQLSDAGKQEPALALLLWRDFKSQGRFDVEVITQMFSLADHLGIKDQLSDMMTKLPPTRIVLRNP